MHSNEIIKARINTASFRKLNNLNADYDDGGDECSDKE